MSCDWLKFQWLNANYSWFYPTADLSSGNDLRLIYNLICRVKLRTYSAKYIIFMATFLTADFSYHWCRLWLPLQKLWKCLTKLEEAWESLKTLVATDSSCSGWFELWWLIRELEPIEYLHNFDSDALDIW